MKAQAAKRSLQKSLSKGMAKDGKAATAIESDRIIQRHFGKLFRRIRKVVG